MSEEILKNEETVEVNETVESVEIPEVEETVETKVEEAIPLEVEEKKPWKVNWFVALIFSVLLLLGGQIIGALIVDIPVGIYVGYKAAMEGADLQAIAQQGYELNPILETTILYLSTIGCWIILLLIFLVQKNRPMFKIFKPVMPGNNVKNFLIGLALGFGMNGFCILVAKLCGNISLSFDAINVPALLLVLVCVFIQSSSEELLCRGYLYQKIMCRYNNPLFAILLSSGFFAALHLLNDGVTVLAILDIFITGILCALLVYYFDSLWCAMALHTAWNFTQNIIFGLPNSGINVPFSIFKLDAIHATDGFAYNVGFGVEGTVLAVIVEIVVTLVVFYIGRKNGPKATNIWE